MAGLNLTSEPEAQLASPVSFFPWSWKSVAPSRQVAASPQVSKMGPDYPSMCSVICPQSPAIKSFTGLMPRIAPISAAGICGPDSLALLWALPPQPLDWPGREGRSTEGVWAVAQPRSLLDRCG